MDAEKRLYASGKNPLSIKPSRPLPREVAVVGAGSMGPDIGYYIKSALPKIKLYLVDNAESSLKDAEKKYENYAGKAVESRKMKEDKAKELLQNIVYTPDYGQIRNCDLVIESGTEDVAAKQTMLQSIEGNVRDDAIITSNTSAVSAETLFSKMKNPERATITHFFAPAWRSLPVELVRWEKASREVMDYLFWFLAQTGKVPFITDDVESLMLDRVFNSWRKEAKTLLSQASAAEIEKVTEEFMEGRRKTPPDSTLDVPENLKKIVRERMLGILFSTCFEIVDRGIGTKNDLNYGCQAALGFKKGPFDIMRELGEAEVLRIVRPKSSFSSYQNFQRFLLVDDVDGVKVITLRRPEALNAISDEINNEILSVLRASEDDPAVKGFVITGYGTRAFSAGADIGKFPQTLGNKEAAVRYAMDCSQVQFFMDKMKKPMVAAVNGMALGGGFEVAIRCQSILAMKSAFFQFPEITLGIIPGIGGCIVPYRRWPQGAKLFHEMICLARPINAQEALEIGMVSKVVDDYPGLIRAAVEEVKNLQGKIKRIPDGTVEIPDFSIPDPPMAGKQVLSREVIGITVNTIKEGAAAKTFTEALEIGYKGNAVVACTEAAKEGISAFLEKRRPEFKK